MKKFVFLMIIISFFFFSFGCTSTLKSMPDNYSVRKDAESIVIGQIAFPAEEILASGSSLIRARAGYMSVKNTDTGQKFRIVPGEFNKKYYFYVPLPVGKYQVTEINWGGFRGEPRGFFIIDENNKTIYIGSVTLTKIEETVGQKVTRWFIDNISGTKSVPIEYSVLDNYDNVVISFRERYPGKTGEIEKSLMIIHE